MDWNKGWKQTNGNKGKNYGVDFWNKRAENFRKNSEIGMYEKNFFRLAEIPKEATIFDMGCGAGTLTLPLAAEGHEVYASDFSPVMLDILKKEAEERNIADKIHITHMNWEDDWSDYDIPVCDVAISSRSLIVKDLREGLEKLSSKSRDLICIVSGTAVSTHINTKIATEIGFKDIPSGNYMYIVQALLDMGIMPKLDYINSDRNEKFSSFDECVEKMSTKYFPRELNNKELKNLTEYAKKHLVEEDGGENGVHLVFDEPWPVRWAFISWHKGAQLPEDVRKTWKFDF